MQVEASSLLEARRLYYRFENQITIDVIQASIRPGQHIALCGPSGCGKSTALGMLSLSLRPEKMQKFFFNGQDILPLLLKKNHNRLSRLRAEKIGFVPQTASLLPFLTIQENIAFNQKMAGVKDKTYVKALLLELGLERISHRFPHQVSVGQRQRTAVARALSAFPSLILADEPTASIHPTQADQVLDLMKTHTQHYNTAIIMATHDPDRAKAKGFEVTQCILDYTTQTTLIHLGHN